MDHLCFYQNYTNQTEPQTISVLKKKVKVTKEKPDTIYCK